MNVNSVRSDALVKRFGLEVVISVIIFGAFEKERFAFVTRELSRSERTVCRKVGGRTGPCVLIERDFVFAERNESGACEVVKELVCIGALFKSDFENVL